MGKIKKEIIAYLKENAFGVLCSCARNDPRATPVRYWNDDLIINIFSEKYTAKFKILEKNQNVSFAVYSAKPPAKGLQLWGRARVFTCKDPRHDACLPPQVKNSPKIEAIKKTLHLIQVTPHKIVMLDQSRKSNKYFKWERGKDGKAREKEIKTLRGASKL